MFDRYSISSGSQHITAKISVEEKRAPTDVSIQLLREMEDKARKEVIGSLTIQGNNFSAVVFECWDPIFFNKIYRVVLELNGYRSFVDVSIPDGSTQEEIINILITRVGEHVAKNMLYHAFKEGIEKGFKSGVQHA